MALSHQARLNGVVLLKIDGAVHEILMKNMWPLGHMWPSLVYEHLFYKYIVSVGQATKGKRASLLWMLSSLLLLKMT